MAHRPPSTLSREPYPLLEGQKPAARVWLGVGVVAIGLLAGVAANLPPPVIAASLAGAGLALVLGTGGRHAEKALALYWAAFCLFSTVLTAYVVDGMFILFYLSLVVAVLAILVTRGVVIDVPAAWVFAGLFIVVFASLNGYLGSLGGVTLDRLLFVPLGLLAMLVVASGRAPTLLLGSMVATSVAVATWVIVTAADAGFAYRGSVDVDQNVVSFYVGIGFTLCFAWLVSRSRPSQAGGRVALAALALVGLGYSLVILASRGAIISLGVVAMVALAHALYSAPRRAWRVALLLLLVSSGLLLPGGQGILERFEDPSTETGGGRVLIWETVVGSMQSSTLPELLIGHGMGSSAQLISEEFGYLSSTHNSFLLALYDYGLLGAVLFLLLHLLVLARAWRGRDELPTQVLLLLVFQLSIGMFITASDNYLYWISLGALLGATSVTRRDAGLATDAAHRQRLV